MDKEMAPGGDANVTPLMRQYGELKEQSPDALLFFRMGDFYELFGDDAVTAARLLEITLTSRDKGKANALPMAGVPHHSAAAYIQRLLKAGRKVAIAEQMEDPATVKGSKSIVRREIMRVFTPAVNFEAEGSETHYLATALPEPSQDNRWRLACLDAATGEARTSEPLSEEELLQQLAAHPIRHFLRVGEQLPEGARTALSEILFEDLPSNLLSEDQAQVLLCHQYGLATLEGFFETPTTARALGFLVRYVQRSQRQDSLPHLRLPLPLRASQCLELGPRTAQHLDLFPSADGTPNLFGLINRTRSAAGARLLRRWILEPLREVAPILDRQESIRHLHQEGRLREKLGLDLSATYDLERILGRVTTGLSHPRDTAALGQTLHHLRAVAASLQNQPLPARLHSLASRLTEKSRALEALETRILTTQRTPAPLIARDGGIFQKGFHPELDRLITLNEEGERWLIELEARERESTGIASLKVRYNRVFGYYIEVTTAHLKNVPSHYQRKQTTVGAERFFTEELKKFEDEIVHASSRQKALEQELFEQLLQTIRAETSQVAEVALIAAELDALRALGELGDEPGWNFPTIDESQSLEIRGGRHPLVDATAGGKFVPNDTQLGESESRVLLITGPNMGGKSTIMRQVALIVLLGQLGAPVPATSARWGVFTQLFTRIGAHDAIARGQSTFMVEMNELAQILHRAGSRALLILDEIGRGTSTYDGMSVAWSSLEWICKKTGARALFATHYHELTRLPTELPSLSNAHLAVDVSAAGDLRFLYQLRPGPTNDSFGIHVAKLAGLPGAVVARAWEVLEKLEKNQDDRETIPEAQLSLFQAPTPRALPAPVPAEIPEEREALERIRGLTLETLTPLAALNWLAQVQDDLRGSTRARTS